MACLLSPPQKSSPPIQLHTFFLSSEKKEQNREREKNKTEKEYKKRMQKREHTQIQAKTHKNTSEKIPLSSF